MKKAVDKFMLTLFVVLTLSSLPLSANAEWWTGIKVNQVLGVAYSNNNNVIQFMTDNTKEICSGITDPRKFYFSVDHPLAKYWYTSLLTAQVTNRLVNLVIVESNPECFNGGPKIYGVWLLQ